MQAAVPSDPLSHGFRICRPQDPVGVSGNGLIAFDIPGTVEDQAGARRNAETISWNDTQQHRARRGAGAIDLDALAGYLQRAIFRQVSADLPTAIIADPHRRRGRRERKQEKNRRQS